MGALNTRINCVPICAFTSRRHYLVEAAELVACALTMSRWLLWQCSRCSSLTVFLRHMLRYMTGSIRKRLVYRGYDYIGGSPRKYLTLPCGLHKLRQINSHCTDHYNNISWAGGVRQITDSLLRPHLMLCEVFIYDLKDTLLPIPLNLRVCWSIAP